MTAVTRVLMVLVPSLLIAVALFSVPALVFGERGLPRLRALTQRLEVLDEQNDELRRENELLRRRIHAVRDEPRQIEWIARQELGLVRPNEFVFHF